jgi:hypothetical protein
VTLHTLFVNFTWYVLCYIIDTICCSYCCSKKCCCWCYAVHLWQIKMWNWNCFFIYKSLSLHTVTESSVPIYFHGVEILWISRVLQRASLTPSRSHFEKRSVCLSFSSSVTKWQDELLWSLFVRRPSFRP